MRGRAGTHDDLARRPDADPDALERPAARCLDIVAKTEPDVAALGSCGFLAGLEAGPSCGCQSARLAFGIVTAIVSHRAPVALANGNRERHSLRRDEIAAANLVTREPELRRDPVEQSLHDERALWTAGAPRRSARRLVRQAKVDLDLVGRKVVRPDQVCGGIERKRDTVGRGRAMLVAEVAADPEQFAVAVEGDLHVPILLMLERRRREVLEPILGPFYRTIQQQGSGRDRQFLRMEYGLGAESAADIGRRDADLIFVHAERRDEDFTGSVWHLR